MISFVGNSQNKSDDFDKLYKTATKKFEFGDYVGAQKIYNQIFLQDSLNKELHFNMGVCDYQLKKIRTSKTAFF